MPNKYVYNRTFDDQHYEEDRACDNDLKRSKIDYYNMKYLILERVYDVLCNMTDDEIKKSIINNNIAKRL